ncbi:MAG: Flp family type IVb pilin [bacterium]
MTTRLWIRALLRFRALARDERGVNLVEYALMLAFAVLLVLVAVQNFSNSFVEAVNFVAKELDNAVNPT